MATAPELFTFEHLRGPALRFQSMTNYIVRSLVQPGGSDHSHTLSRELRRPDPISSRFSLLRVLDLSAPTQGIDAAESHFK